MMDFRYASTLLTEGEVEAIRRKAWAEKAPDACLSFPVEPNTCVGYFLYCSTVDGLHECRPWNNPAEDCEARDWQVYPGDPSLEPPAEVHGLAKELLDAGWEWADDEPHIIRNQGDEATQIWVDPYSGNIWLPPEVIESLRRQIRGEPPEWGPEYDIVRDE